MGQCHRHNDDELTMAGGEFYDTIRSLQNQGVPNHKIIRAATAELSGLTGKDSRRIDSESDTNEG